MPKKITPAAAAAEERHSINRHVYEKRDRAVNEYSLLPIKAVVPSIAELLEDAGELRIPFKDTMVSLRDVLYMANQEAAIETLNGVQNFIEGMAKRDNEREGGLGRQ